MSTASRPAAQGQAAPQAAQAGRPAAAPAQQGPQGAQSRQPAQQASPPARQGGGRSATRSSWSTPRLLRLVRAGAATAVLLTGVAATGTFSTGGLNATPDVIAQQWVAAERAGVEIAHADLRAAERVAGGDQEGAREAFDEAVTQVGIDLTAIGVERDQAAQIAREWSGFVLGAERAAAAQTGADPQGAGVPTASDYAAASVEARSALERTDAAAEQHARDLRTGSRSVLTGTVGSVATIGLVALMVWLALRTRRIVNVPLLVATAITAGLTYLSINPAAMPLTYDQRLEETTSAATALQEVYQVRAGQHAAALGEPLSSPEDGRRAREAVETLGVPAISAAWEPVGAAHDQVVVGGVDRDEAAELLAATQEAFESAEAGLREHLDARLSDAATAVGRPAGITSGAALVLGLVGAAFAWTGLTRRLGEYR